MPSSELHEFLQGIPIPCHEIDLSGKVVFVNEAECRLLLLDPCHIVGQRVSDFVTPEQHAISTEAVRLKLSGQKPLAPFEREYMRPDGAHLILEIHETHIRDEAGRIVGIRSFMIDVTARKRSETALKESEKLYRHLVEHASDIIYRTDIHGRFTVVNAVASELMGYSRDELVGKPYLDLIRTDFRAAVRRFYRRQLTGKLSHTYLEFPAVTADGDVLWFGQNVELIEDDGRVTGFQAITREISLQRRSEEEMRKAREDLEKRVKARTEQLERANEQLRLEIEERYRQEKARRELEAQVQHAQRLESLGVLAGGIAHDFNNLLTVIVGHAGLALSDIPEASPARESVEAVVAAARNAAQLTEQMLAYSGRGKFQLERINLSDFMESITRLLSTIISKKASLRLQLKAGLPLIEGDAAQIRQVVINLLTNASDALGDREGTITVSTGVRSFQADELRPSSPGGPLPGGDYVFLEVADTGCGMDQVTMGKIFDPFFTTKFTGRGLGLAAVHGIVRGHRGALQVESVPGLGTTFRVFFPAFAETASGAEDESEIIAEPKAELSGRILVVDDEPAVRQLACKILEQAGLEVTTAVDGYDAVKQFEARPAEIDLVILDLTMPGLDGAEVFERLTRIRPDAKVILCSGYNLTEFVPALGGGRPHATLRKPYTPAELINSVSSVL